MFKIGFRTFFQNYPYFLFVAVLLLVVDLLGFSSAGAMVVVNAIVAIASHRMVLLGQDYGWTGMFAKGEHPRERYGRFVLFYLFFFMTYLTFCGLFTWAWMRLGNISIQDEDLFFASLLIAALAALLPNGLVLARFGGVLPAAAIGEKRTLREAGLAAKSTFSATFGRLFMGSFLLPACLFAAVFALQMALAPSQDAYHPINLMAVFLFKVVGLVAIHFAATALGLAFLATQKQQSGDGAATS